MAQIKVLVARPFGPGHNPRNNMVKGENGLLNVL